MNKEHSKQELIKRYKYLYENAPFILAPFMHEQKEDEHKKIKEHNLEKYGTIYHENPLIYLNINTLDEINLIFEEFLLSDISYEESRLYKLIESKRNDKNYLNEVKKGLMLVEKYNLDKKWDVLKLTLDISKILQKVSNYIDEQSADLVNKKRKLSIIDQYYRIFRYKNDGKVYTSGRKLNLHDCSSISIPLGEMKPIRDNEDIGVTNNTFIKSITSLPRYEYNLSILTEEEKQQIYLEYHNELPYNLQIKCQEEEPINLRRPDYTDFCGKNFTVIEEEIFCIPISYNPIIYSDKYYQLCPHCGFIVQVPNELLSYSIKKKIEKRNKEDRFLSRKMFLYSELISLENLSPNKQKRLIKR